MTTQITVSQPKIIIKDNKSVTASKAVAEYFGKQHKNVLKKINHLDCSLAFTSANFFEHDKNIEAGAVYRDSKYYEMAKDGFVFLTRFTGKKV